MKGDNLPLEDTVGKHCQPKDFIQDEDEDGKMVPVGVRGETFFPDDDGVSVGWLEFYSGDRNAQIRSMVACMKSVRTVKKSHRLALLSVNAILGCGQLRGANIRVEHDPIEGYDCHSLVVGIDSNESELMSLIATEILTLEAMLIEP